MRDISLGLCLLFSSNLYHCSVFHLQFTFPATVSWSVFWRCYQFGLVKNCSDVLQSRLCSLSLEQRSKGHKPRHHNSCLAWIWNLLLPMHMAIRCCEYLRHTAAAQIAYKIIPSRSTQVELGKVEGFRETLKARCKNLKWMLASHMNSRQ